MFKPRSPSGSINNKLYTYGYYHNGFNGLDPNGETPNGTILGANNVPGQEMNNNYRAWGDVLTAERKIGPGTLQMGAGSRISPTSATTSMSTTP